MKRMFLMSLICLWGGLGLYAQYTPNTRWPYLLEEFQNGTIYFDGNKKSEAQLNVHLWANTLHYIHSDGRIFESTDKDIIRVEIGDKAYLFAGRQLMELIGESNGNVLLKLSKADFDSMQEGTGAYGASLNSSAKMDLTSLDLGGMDKPELAKMQAEKNDGREIPMLTQYFFIVDGRLVEASKKQVSGLLGDERAQSWKSFQKEHKIKWKKEESLLKVLEFLTQK